MVIVGRRIATRAGSTQDIPGAYPTQLQVRQQIVPMFVVASGIGGNDGEGLHAHAMHSYGEYLPHNLWRQVRDACRRERHDPRVHAAM